MHSRDRHQPDESFCPAALSGHVRAKRPLSKLLSCKDQLASALCPPMAKHAMPLAKSDLPNFSSRTRNFSFSLFLGGMRGLETPTPRQKSDFARISPSCFHRAEIVIDTAPTLQIRVTPPTMFSDHCLSTRNIRAAVEVHKNIIPVS